MRITGPGATRDSASIRKKKGASEATEGFNNLLSSETADADGAQAVVSTPPMSGIGALLSAQEVEEQLTPQEGFERGEALLKQLEAIRHGLLVGSLPKQQLMHLSQMVERERNRTADPKLNAILDDIELRAAVELAKLEQG